MLIKLTPGEQVDPVVSFHHNKHRGAIFQQDGLQVKQQFGAEHCSHNKDNDS